MKFDPQACDIEAAITSEGMHVEEILDVVVPENMVTDENLHDKMMDYLPVFVPIDKHRKDPFVTLDLDGPVVQSKLSNCLRINYRVSDNEPGGALVRVVAAGGR